MKTRQIFRHITDFFFPRSCVSCGRILASGEQFICLPCLTALPRTRFHLHADNRMEKNLWGKLPFERAASWLFYSKASLTYRIIAELKYRGNGDLGLFLGRCMAEELLPSGFFQGISCIIPVPLHSSRLRQRGYNQSGKLAEGIAQRTGIPVCTEAVVRHKKTESQTHKAGFMRWTAMQDAFTCTQPDMLRDKHVLLLDDVMTTGATIVACADACRDIPGIRFSILTLAVAGYQ